VCLAHHAAGLPEGAAGATDGPDPRVLRGHCRQVNSQCL
jgi:hypothetical protein